MKKTFINFFRVRIIPCFLKLNAACKKEMRQPTITQLLLTKNEIKQKIICQKNAFIINKINVKKLKIKIFKYPWFVYWTKRLPIDIIFSLFLYLVELAFRKMSFLIFLLIIFETLVEKIIQKWFFDKSSSLFLIQEWEEGNFF